MYCTWGCLSISLEAPLPLSPASAPTLAYDVCDDDLTGRAGLGVVARLARFLGLPELLAASARLQRRRRGGSAGQMLLALLYAACAGGGHLHAIDALGPMPSHAERAGCGPCPPAGGWCRWGAGVRTAVGVRAGVRGRSGERGGGPVVRAR